MNAADLINAKANAARLELAEQKLVEVKELLQVADAFNWLVMEAEKLQLRVHYDVMRAKAKVEEMKR